MQDSAQQSPASPSTRNEPFQDDRDEDSDSESQSPVSAYVNRFQGRSTISNLFRIDSDTEFETQEIIKWVIDCVNFVRHSNKSTDHEQY